MKKMKLKNSIAVKKTNVQRTGFLKTGLKGFAAQGFESSFINIQVAPVLQNCVLTKGFSPAGSNIV